MTTPWGVGSIVVGRQIARVLSALSVEAVVNIQLVSVRCWCAAGSEERRASEERDRSDDGDGGQQTAVCTPLLIPLTLSMSSGSRFQTPNVHVKTFYIEMQRGVKGG